MEAMTEERLEVLWARRDSDSAEALREVRRLRAEVERVKALESAARGLLGARDGLVKARLDDVGPLGVHEALEVVMAAERALRALLKGVVHVGQDAAAKALPPEVDGKSGLPCTCGRV